MAAPIAPPGWFLWKTLGREVWYSSLDAAIARASPRARAMVVDIVGAFTPKAASSDIGSGAGRRIVPGRCLIISQAAGEEASVMMSAGNDGLK